MNAYLTGIEGMPKLLDCCEDDPMQYFKKKTYADSFQKMYQQHITTFDAIEQGYNTLPDGYEPDNGCIRPSDDP